MRYTTKDIYYSIQDCTIKKQDDMETAFSIIEEQTILNFYPLETGGEISITCDDKNKVEGGLFIAGEGGPTNITETENFNIILKGKILLIKDSTCQNPNVAIHELLHALGFDHSDNPNNIMYKVSRCRQELGQDILDTINSLYAIPSLPDLSFEEVSASKSGRYLDLVISIRNNGLSLAPASKIIVLSNEKQIEEVETESLSIGYGRQITLTNIFTLQNIEELDLIIETNFEELTKDNNLISLKIKE